MSDINDIFQESLSILGLDSARYYGLPFNLRRKTLSFDLYNEVSDIFDGNLRFANKEIFNFSKNEIENHEKVFNSCVALVCLGNEEYIKPLLNYLDFPEPRWSIKIDFVLNTILNDSNHEYSLLTHNQKVELQKKFISKYFYSNVKDLSESLLNNKKTFDFSSYIERVQRSKPKTKEISILDYSKSFEDELTCSEYFYTKSFQFLKKKKVDDLISWLDNSASENNILFLNSCTSSIRDALIDSHISKASSYWINKLKASEAAPVTSIIIFQAISGKKGNRKLANRFVHEFISDSLNRHQVAAISDLYECSYRKNSITRITNFLNDYEKLSTSTKTRIDQINPIIRLYYKSNLANIYFSEKESLNLISDKPLETSLFESFWKVFKSTSQTFRKISELKISSSNALKKLSSDLNVIAELRKDFEEKSLKLKPNQLSNEYVKTFESIVNKSTTLRLPDGDKKIPEKHSA